MKIFRKTATQVLWVVLSGVLMTACGDNSEHSRSESAHGTEAESEPVKGPHRGRLLTAGEFSLELAIFETGVPPEFRAWATISGNTIAPEEVDLGVTLTRLGNKFDDIRFTPFGDALRGDAVIYEPHSFVVSIKADHKGKTYTWEYDNFEGRTKISAEVAEALEIETLIAEPRVLQEAAPVLGRITPNKESVRTIRARFDGVIKAVHASIGDTVTQGQALAVIESNESLKPYTIEAPISGVVTQRAANPGEQTSGRILYTIMDTSTVWAELSLFPADRERIKVGAPVRISSATGKHTIESRIDRINIEVEANQSVTARVVLNNEEGRFLPGMYVRAQVTVGQYSVPLAVKRSGLQAFRDFTVVYARIGEEYEVRMLELGREAGAWVEVQGGIDRGTRYVSENSYVIKADIEKSGASHDH